MLHRLVLPAFQYIPVHLLQIDLVLNIERGPFFLLERACACEHVAMRRNLTDSHRPGTVIESVSNLLDSVGVMLVRFTSQYEPSCNVLRLLSHRPGARHRAHSHVSYILRLQSVLQPMQPERTHVLRMYHFLHLMVECRVSVKSLEFKFGTMYQ
jgi:hypothetical protein